MPIPPQGAPSQGAPSPEGSKKKPKRVRSSGDLKQLQRKLWQAVNTAEEIAMDPDLDPATRIRALHAVVQAATAYLRVSQPAEFEVRLKRIEDDDRSGPGAFPEPT